jgi:hypothetical protein
MLKGDIHFPPPNGPVFRAKPDAETAKLEQRPPFPTIFSSDH